MKGENVASCVYKKESVFIKFNKCNIVTILCSFSLFRDYNKKVSSCTGTSANH